MEVDADSQSRKRAREDEITEAGAEVASPAAAPEASKKARTSEAGGSGGRQRHATVKGSKKDRVRKANVWDQDKNTSRSRTKKNEEEAAKAKAMWTEYYKDVIPASEWDEFVAAMERPLPTSFRINGLSAMRDRLVEQVRTELQFDPVTIDGQVVEAPKVLPWYPGDLAWSIACDKKTLRKHDTTRKLQSWLVQNAATGDVWRQEAVSMIPALLLDVRPEHVVLDLCASPGSKTSQLLDALHRGYHGSVPSGLVVANEMNSKRAYMLCHRMKRFLSPCFLATAHDGRTMPYLRPVPGSASYAVAQADAAASEAAGSAHRVPRGTCRYDRILADVPCSGDGTIRKNAGVLRKWAPSDGLTLHAVQLTLALRCVSLLRVGGRMVYSTCATNPVENEAVVAQVVRQTKGAVRVVDVSSALPGLKRADGLTSWRVAGNSMEWHSNTSTVEKRRKNKRLVRAVFPPNKEEGWIAEQLPRCMRVYPHHQDTGAFFVAVLEKVSEYTEFTAIRPRIEGTARRASPTTAPSGADGEANRASAGPSAAAGAGAGAGAGSGSGDGHSTAGAAPVAKPAKSEVVAPADTKRASYNTKYHHLSPVKESTWEGIKEYFGLSDEFPRDCLFTSNEAMEGRLYLTCSRISDVLRGPKKDKLKVVNSGLRVFEKIKRWKESSAPYRLVQDGLPFLLPYLTKRVLRIPFQSLRLIASTPTAGSVNRASEDPAIRAAVEGLSSGPIAFVTTPPAGIMAAGLDAAGGKSSDATLRSSGDIVVAALLGPKAFRVQMSKEDLTWFRRFVGVPEPPRLPPPKKKTTDPAAPSDAADTA